MKINNFIIRGETQLRNDKVFAPSKVYLYNVRRAKIDPMAPSEEGLSPHWLDLTRLTRNSENSPLKVKRAIRQKVEILNDLLIKTGKLE